MTAGFSPNRSVKPGTDAGTVSPFHEGETRIQERLGDRDVEFGARKGIRGHMPEQHRAFFCAQPFLVASARDADGRPWATLLAAKADPVSSPDPASLAIAALPVAGDALDGAFRAGADIGLLGIELATRRRNRVNGRISGVGQGGFSFSVGQSFGNCPQYIRTRDLQRVDGTPSVKAVRGAELSSRQAEWVMSADTFFIASGYRGNGDDPSFGMDVSHRGGPAGFVEVVDTRHLRFPDYAGNRFYNTLGNILMDPRAGLLFVDFGTGSLLQVTGRAGIDFTPADARRFPGAQRVVSFEIDAIVELSSAVPLRWSRDGSAVRSLRLAARHQESADVVSLVFEARDGGPLAPFSAGQHLPIEISIPGAQAAVGRSYSLSGSPADGRYRISVKRHPEGTVSGYLHDGLEIGATVNSLPPAGGFDIGNAEVPLVLVSAGIGVTPMLSSLHAIAEENDSRPVWFVHGARDGLHHAFRQEVRGLRLAHRNIQAITLYSRPLPEDLPGQDYDAQGRITGALVRQLSVHSQTRFLLCGPSAFVEDLQADLEAGGVPAQFIQSESF